MRTEEITEVIDWIANTDFGKLDIQDQIVLIGAISEMAERVKPIMIKQANESGHTFLFKL